MCVDPRKPNVDDFGQPGFSDLARAFRPNSISRVLSGCSVSRTSQISSSARSQTTHRAVMKVDVGEQGTDHLRHRLREGVLAAGGARRSCGRTGTPDCRSRVKASAAPCNWCSTSPRTNLTAPTQNLFLNINRRNNSGGLPDVIESNRVRFLSIATLMRRSPSISSWIALPARIRL
jgi:hypothetical protein